MQKAVIVENLSKNYFKKEAVKEISFTINENEILGLLGPNGCGKTTTIAMMLGLLKPSNGRVVIHGLDIEKNRVSLAKALINEPSILFLDEPTASLDPETGDFVRSFIEKISKEKKMSILLASHNMDEVKRLCKNVLMMKDGLLIDQGTPNELIKKHGKINLEEVFLKLNRTSNEF